MPPQALHLHTYFLFPFSLDRDVVVADHQALWSKHHYWIEGLDEWIAAHHSDGRAPVADKLGPWQRAAYKRFDVDSQAYQDMVFFHSFVRRVFFDTHGPGGAASEESLLRVYSIPTANRNIQFCAEDNRGRSASMDVSDLRLFLFANGIGILTIGCEGTRRPVAEALWVNEMMRKVYPSSGRQLREGRVPSRSWLSIGGETVVEENSTVHSMIGFQPPLSKVIRSLLYFANYDRQEYEPVLDERMLVYSYMAVDPESVRQSYFQSEDYQILLSRFLYVDRDSSTYRYDPDFIRERMKEEVYWRWAHQATYYGFTSYSNISITAGTFDCDEHVLREGFLIHRMFDTRYYLMAIIALFYRATLIDFAERSALVSRRIYRDQEDGKLSPENIKIANNLRAEFLFFSNYWYFDELANKDEEIDHFTMQCREYRIEPMKQELEQELDKLNAHLIEYFQTRNTEAVNRLAMMSMILGGGAVLTGFFGMNFGLGFGKVFFEPDPRNPWIHWVTVGVVSFLAMGALAFGFYLVVANWADYKTILLPRRRHDLLRESLKRAAEAIDSKE